MRARLLLVVAVVAVLGACAGRQQPALQVHSSRTVEFASLKQAARAAEAVVEISVETSGSVETVGSIPFTVTEARVVDVLKGDFEGAAIRLRQLGAEGEQGPAPEGELLEPGRRYVVMVLPFTFADYQPTGQHVVVGGWQGLYRAEGDLLVATDKARTSLPRAIKRSAFVAEVGTP